jgi:hypothetical protein
VGGGDQLIGTIAAAVDTPESIRAIRNFLLLMKFFANIPPDVLTSLADTVNAGAKREKAQKAPGLLRLLWRLRSRSRSCRGFGKGAMTPATIRVPIGKVDGRITRWREDILRRRRAARYLRRLQ